MPRPIPTAEECYLAGVEAVRPMRDFIAEHEAMSLSEWQSEPREPELTSVRQHVVALASEAVQRGCEEIHVDAAAVAAIGQLDGTGEVGALLVEAFGGADAD